MIKRTFLLFLYGTLLSCSNSSEKESTAFKDFELPEKIEIPLEDLKKIRSLPAERDSFLNKFIFNGLKNLNTGFDAEAIKYFSEDEFAIVLQRVQNYNIGITGIEPWKDGQFYDVAVYEDYKGDANDNEWYMAAFEEFKNMEDTLQYSASYSVPIKLFQKSK